MQKTNSYSFMRIIYAIGEIARLWPTPKALRPSVKTLQNLRDNPKIILLATEPASFVASLPDLLTRTSKELFGPKIAPVIQQARDELTTVVVIPRIKADISSSRPKEDEESGDVVAGAA
jgi:hypothetical protein